MNDGYEYRERVAAAGGRDRARLPGAPLSALDRGRLAAAHRRGRGARSTGASRRADDVLRAGQTLVWRRPPWEEPAVPLAFAVLFRDAHLLAVAKPRGLPTMPAGGFLTHTLLHLVQQRFPAATAMHRLGRGTSGLVLFARTRRGAPRHRAGLALGRGGQALSRAGDRRAVARARSSWTRRSASWPIRASAACTPRRREGKPALTHVRVLAARDGAGAGGGHDPHRTAAPDPHPPGRGRASARRRSAVRRGRRAGAGPGPARRLRVPAARPPARARSSGDGSGRVEIALRSAGRAALVTATAAAQRYFAFAQACSWPAAQPCLKSASARWRSRGTPSAFS